MFLRVVRASGGKGVKHEYLRLVEAYRDDAGKTQHRTILNLGRMDLLATHLDIDKLNRLLHGTARPKQLEALKSVRVVDIDLGNGTTKRSVTKGTQRAAAVLRALAVTELNPPAPPKGDQTVL